MSDASSHLTSGKEKQPLQGETSSKLPVEDTSQGHKYTNRLIHEQSPYLLQHAHNPVDWYPWGEEAFKKAREENKPIFLSVGYSTCHWCHVMERESFENENIARLMNSRFVNIKVDREERPDIDHVYMTFVQATTGGGGWPMSVFLTPDLKPFFGGTYFAPTDVYGRISFVSLMNRIHHIWTTKQEQIKTQSAEVIESLREQSLYETATATATSTSSQQSRQRKSANQPFSQYVSDEPLVNGLRKFQIMFDSKFGGFGAAPKFPRPSIFNFLFHMYDREHRLAAHSESVASTSAAAAVASSAPRHQPIAESTQGQGHSQSASEDSANRILHQCLFTLQRMAHGGIYDHLGGGFHRYSTDKEWHLPHFEKMLYDQAQLVVSYLDAYQTTRDPFFANVARDVLQYVQRDMTHAEGGFFSAEDADSLPSPDSHEKVEGAFYAWSSAEIARLLDQSTASAPTGPTNSEIFNWIFDVRANGNIPSSKDPHGELRGKNVLIKRHSFAEAANHFNLSESDIESRIQSAKRTLFKTRETRPRPHLDDKIITAWNGLMISAFARAYQLFPEDKSLLQSAVNAALFVRNYLYSQQDGILLRSYRTRPANVEGFLSDYSFMVQALLDLYEASPGDVQWLIWAQALQLKQVELFYDQQTGNFYEVTGRDESILLRMKEDYDGAEPSGNSVSAMNLLRLERMLNREEFRHLGERCLAAHYELLLNTPQVAPQMLCALDFYLRSATQYLIVYTTTATTTAAASTEQQKQPREGEGERAAATGFESGAGSTVSDTDVNYDLSKLLRVIHSVYTPNKVLIVVNKTSNASDQAAVQALEFLRTQLPVLGEAEAIGGKPTLYLCRNSTCQRPMTDLSEIQAAL